MSTMLSEAGRGCGRSLVIQVIAVVIVVPLACLLIFLPLSFVSRSNLSIWYLIIPASLFLLILFGGGAGAMAFVFTRRARHLDTVFTPLGLTGQLYQMFFRQYHGSVEGREVGVYLYRGPSLELDISTSLQTRLGVTQQQRDTLFLARLFNREPLSLTDPALDGLTVFALDEDWTRKLLARPGVPELLQRLAAFESSFTRRHVLLRPGWIRLHLFGSRNLLDFKFDITPEQGRQWLDDLATLARIAESLPAPQITDEESSAERLASSLRNRSPYLVPAITVGVILAVILCSVAVGVAAFLFASAQ
jgi:hypothetical protein